MSSKERKALEEMLKYANKKARDAIMKALKR